MKLLLDENLPHKFRDAFHPEHEAFTVAYMGWDGIRNGQLLKRAADASFQALITTDQGIEYEQNRDRLPIAVIVLVAPNNKLSTLEALIPPLLDAIEQLEPNTLVKVSL